MDGTIDAAMVDADTGQAYIEGNPRCGLMMVPGVHFTLEEQFEGDRIAARKGEGQLIAFVNGVIDEVLASGEYMAWYEEAAERANALGL
jgi:polar amino acid transport system substrate-binding protein